MSWVKRSSRRIAFAFIFLSLASFSLIVFTRQSLLFLAYFITVFYTAWGVYHILLTIKGVGPVFKPHTPPSRFPKVSVIVPALSEPILPRTIEVIVNHQAYPAGSKEVVVVTDDPLGDRVSLFMQQRYPENVRALARRAFYPTKPSALNDALRLCSGEIVGIVDVEDIPDSNVFQKAVSALVDHGYDAAQAILRINNEEDSWITRVFAYEYAGWFRVWLNGRARLGLYTPLGGTGNYFWKDRTVQVGGWDSLNVAEDAELAIRMTLAKMKIGVIDARHWEEAPVTFRKWLRQRTRWFRGWLQSLWKYAPLLWRPGFVKRIGLIKLLSILLMLCTPIVVLLNWVSFALTGLWMLELYGITSPLLSNIFPVWATLPVFFNVVYISSWIIGGRIEKVRTPWWSVILPMLLYTYVMMPLASLRAIYQEITKPVIWEKTEHPGRGVVGFVAEAEVKQQVPAAYQPQMSEGPGGYYATPRRALSEGAAITLWSAVLILDLLFIWLLLSNPSILSWT